MGAVALDASVVIGFLRPDDAHHQAARQILRDHTEATKILPASVYAEILVKAVRAGRAEEVDTFVDDLEAEVVPIDRAVARHAAALRAEHRSLRLPDAMALACADARGATLLTFDKGLLRVRDGR